MCRFRPVTSEEPAASVDDLLAVGQLIDDALRPGHFFVAPELRLDWISAKAETIAWEIFRGRLLDPAQTRERRSFLSWHVLDEDANPILSVKLDVAARAIHVVRGLAAYVWEGHGDGIIESRETVRWTQELVGTIILARFDNLDTLRDELICAIWQALVGTSRLPLHAVEAPLPGFLLGRLHYCYQGDAPESAAATWEAFLDASLQQALGWGETVKLVEFVLRHNQTSLPKLAERVQGLPLRRLLRSLFNNASLSPWTGFAERTLALVKHLCERDILSRPQKLDFLRHLLTQVCRHLTAYDLVTFHHRGANYPDALVLDLALKEYLAEIETGEAEVPGPSLAQTCLMRRYYEGHLVPDAPTSPGENARVMPLAHPRVPEEQLTQVLRRRRVLYEGNRLRELLGPSAREALADSVRDANLGIELGIGVFIDRPLGYGKAPVEPDQTPLLAHLAFSPSIAQRRLNELRKLCAELGVEFEPVLAPMPDGLSHTELAECARPVAALADVRKVADDFRIVRTLPVGLRALLDALDLRRLKQTCRLGFLDAGPPRLCVQARDGVLAWYDDRLRRRIEMTIDASAGYLTRAAMELPQPGLRVLRVWEDTDNPEILADRSVDLLLPPSV
jgi:hypothetical protein